LNRLFKNDEKLLFVDFTIWYVHTMVNTGTLKKNFDGN